MKEIQPNSPVMLYDGVCGLCNRSVQTILDHDKKGRMLFAALQSEYGEAVKARHPSLEKVDSVVLVERAGEATGERVYVRSAAALRIASYLGGAWKLLLVFYLLPAPVRDLFYDLIAKHRYRFFGKSEACMLPRAEVRSRFLDL